MFGKIIGYGGAAYNTFFVWHMLEHLQYQPNVPQTVVLGIAAGLIPLYVWIGNAKI